MPKEETIEIVAVPCLHTAERWLHDSGKYYIVSYILRGLCVRARCLSQDSSLDTFSVSRSVSGSRCLSQDSSLDTFSVSRLVSVFYPKKIHFYFFTSREKI